MHEIGGSRTSLRGFSFGKTHLIGVCASGLAIATYFHRNILRLDEMVEHPHFEDEMAALTARPVVPLARIDARVKRRRRWFLGGAFATAMMLGAASALVSAYFRVRNVPDPEIQTQTVSTPIPADPLPEIDNSFPDLDETSLPEIEEVAHSKAPVPHAENRERTERANYHAGERQIRDDRRDNDEAELRTREEDDLRIRDEQLRARDDARLARDEEEFGRVRDPMGADDWEERRLRRSERRRRKAQRSNRDLSHLNEIFEGPGKH